VPEIAAVFSTSIGCRYSVVNRWRLDYRQT